jgi:hypothetical protein
MMLRRDVGDGLRYANKRVSKPHVWLGKVFRDSQACRG